MENENNENNETNVNKGKITKYEIISIIIALGSLFISAVLFNYARQSNERAKKLFVSQIEPNIDVMNINFEPITDTHCDLKLWYTNDSGFDALNVTVDVRFGPAPSEWIGRWVMVYTGKSVKPQILKSRDKRSALFRGLLPLNKKFAGSNTLRIEGFPIFVRAKWENENGRQYNLTLEYRLFQTKIEQKVSYFIDLKNRIVN